MSIKQSNKPSHFSERNAREAVALRENLKRRRQGIKQTSPTDGKDSST